MPPKKSMKAKPPGFQNFLQDLKSGKLKGVVMMYGAEQYLAEWAVSQIKHRYVMPATEVMDYVVLDGDSASPKDIITAAETFSMMSEKRVIWVKGFLPLKNPGKVAGYGEDGIVSLLRYFENPNAGAVLIFSNEEIDATRKLAKSLKKEGSVYLFDTLTEREFLGFAMKRIQAAGLQIARADMDYLMHATGYYNKESDYRLYHFENDLRKLIAYASDGVIRRQDIDLLVSGDNDTFIFDLIDGISGRNKEKAFEILYHKLHEGGNAIQICATVIGQVELMLYIREFLDSQKGPKTASGMAKRMKMNEFRVKKAMQYTQRFTLPKLKEIVQNAYETYGSIITGAMEPQLCLELFIARM